MENRWKLTKFITVALVIILACSLFAGCSQGSNQPANLPESGASPAAAPAPASQAPTSEPSAAVEEAEEPAIISIYLSSSGVTDDVAAVEAALNEYVQPKINVNVDLTFINSGSFAETVTTMVRSGDPLDVTVLTEINLRSLIAQEAITPLSGLLEQYGQGIEEAVGAEFMQAAYVGGEIYAIPSLKDMALSRMMIYNKEMAETAGVIEDLNAVKSIDDLTPIFEKVATAYPDVDMFGGAPAAQTFETWDADKLSDGLGVLEQGAQTATVVNFFETQHYMDLCNIMRAWYTNGWIDRDIATGTDFWLARLTAKSAFAGFTSYKPGNVETCSTQVGYELGYCIMTPALRTTSNVMNATLCIPASSPNPEKTMQFLQLWYTDPAVAGLIINGIEDIHYEFKDDGGIGYIGTADDAKYYNYGMGWQYGNQFITPTWTGTATDVWDQTREWNKSSTPSVAFGFAYNNSELQNEIAACTNIMTKYRGDLETGTIDPAENIPKFVQELKDNGIDRIIAEKQAQLDAFLAQ